MNQEYKTILVGVDGSKQATEAFKKAIEVARRNHGKVYVANIIDQQFYNLIGYTPMDQNLIDQEAKSAKELIEDCKKYGESVAFTNIEGVVAYGSAKEAMAVSLPEKYGIDLIMVGQSGLNAVERVMTGSVASYVIRQAPCDVLIVRETTEDEKEGL